MRAVMMYGPGDVRVEERPDPVLHKPTDAIIRLSATCVCGSDLWAYRGTDQVDGPAPMGHEYAGVVEEVGSEVSTVKPGDFAGRHRLATSRPVALLQIRGIAVSG